MSANSINNPKHWYDRAAAMRVLSDTIADVETRAIMLRLAADYDKLADRPLDVPTVSCRRHSCYARSLVETSRRLVGVGSSSVIGSWRTLAGRPVRVPHH